MGAGGSTTLGKEEKIPVTDASSRPMVPNTSPATSKDTSNQLKKVPYGKADTKGKGVGRVTRGAEVMNVVQVTMAPLPQGAENKPKDRAAAADEYGWFVETDTNSNRFEMYNEESSTRLEDAFLARTKTVNIVFKKNMFTVDLEVLYQIPMADSSGCRTAEALLANPNRRRVKRAALEVVRDPVTLKVTERKEKMQPLGFVDPFGSEDDEADTAATTTTATAAATTGDAGGDGGTDNEPDGVYPSMQYHVAAHSSAIYTLDIMPRSRDASPGGVTLLTGCKTGKIFEWDSETARVRCRYEAATTSGKTSSSSGGAGAKLPAALTALYSKTGRYVTAGYDDKIGRVFVSAEPAADAADAAPVVSPSLLLKGHTHKVYGITMDCAERFVLSVSMDGHLNTYDPNAHAAASGDLAAAGGGGRARPPTELEPLRSEHCHASHIFSICASQTQSSLCLSCGDDALLCVHDLRLGASTVAARAKGHTSTLWSCDINAAYGDVYYASGGMDSSVFIWDSRNLASPVIVNRKHTKPVHCVRFTPQGRGVLSSSKDQYMMLTELIDAGSGDALSSYNNMNSGGGGGGALSTCKVVWKAKAHGASVFRALLVERIHGDSKRNQIITCSADNTVGVWDWPGATQQGW